VFAPYIPGAKKIRVPIYAHDWVHSLCIFTKVSATNFAVSPQKVSPLIFCQFANRSNVIGMWATIEDLWAKNNHIMYLLF
jgi:hypothetical protein